MCLDCGCFRPNETHGDDRHITFDMLQAAATANGRTIDDVIQVITDSFNVLYVSMIQEEQLHELELINAEAADALRKKLAAVKLPKT